MITIELPWPDKRLSPNSRCHWHEKAEAAKIAREQGLYGVLEITYIWPKDKAPPLKPLPEQFEAQYTFHPPDKRHRDVDNVHSSCKNFQDGVCDALEIDDSRIKRTVLEWGEVVKGGKVVLRLEEMK
jgi:crossover junction endodeoxyribonuclease RusA